MTKYYEEYIRTDIDKLEPFKSDPKGELTIVISEKLKEKNSSINLKESDKINIQKMIKKLSIKEFEYKYLKDSSHKKEIDAYPTIYLVKGNNVVEFDSDITEDNLTNFLNTAL